MTVLLNADRETDIAQAIDLLDAGKLVAVPTETVYGLAADARQTEAVRSIFIAKQRPVNHPLIVHVGDIAQISEWAAAVPPAARQLAERFWPGPLTLIMKKALAVDPVVTGGLDTIALRIPAHPALLKLLKQSGLALAAPSANPHKSLSPTTASQVMATMRGKLAAVLDGGRCNLGLESTILDLTGPDARLLRAGPLTATQLSEHLGRPVFQPQQHSTPVSGNLSAHYRPNTPLFLKTAAQIAINPGYPVARLLLSKLDAVMDTDFATSWFMPSDKPAYASLLYQALYEADLFAMKEIWVELPPFEEEWLDVYDRLLRASENNNRTDIESNLKNLFSDKKIVFCD